MGITFLQNTASHLHILLKHNTGEFSAMRLSVILLVIFLAVVMAEPRRRGYGGRRGGFGGRRGGYGGRRSGYGGRRGGYGGRRGGRYGRSADPVADPVPESLAYANGGAEAYALAEAAPEANANPWGGYYGLGGYGGHYGGGDYSYGLHHKGYWKRSANAEPVPEAGYGGYKGYGGYRGYRGYGGFRGYGGYSGYGGYRGYKG